MPARTRLIDVSHVVEDGMVTYKGLPAPVICDWRTREESRVIYDGAEFQIGKVEMVANTGTYVDSPFHRYANGKDLSELPLESVADLECVVVRVDPATGPAIDSIPLTDSEIAAGLCCFTPGGTGSGARMPTSSRILTSPSGRPNGWRRLVRRSSESIQ